MLKERSLMIAMDEETLKKQVDALSTDGTVANHFKTKLGLSFLWHHQINSWIPSAKRKQKKKQHFLTGCKNIWRTFPFPITTNPKSNEVDCSIKF